MAQAYYESGTAETEGCFHLFFRDNPFGGGFTIACGLEQVLEWLEAWHFTDEDVSYLAERRGSDGNPLFTRTFLATLSTLRFTGEIDAVPEGTVVFPTEPLLRLHGPLPVCQLVESALLNMINFQTLVATKSARVRLAAGIDPVMEFGLRRAQGPDGAVSASRAAYIGGCDSTSNVAAGELFGIPVAGTHAHSWVQAFDSESEAFEAYAEALPNNVTLLIDTYDTLEGARRAVLVAQRLRERGRELLGVRIDSGDLAWLSHQVREILDEAGFPDVKVVASNELDEHLIGSLKDQGAAVDVWGVGTKLVTGWDQPALGGVYKLSSIRRSGESWTPRIKVSEQAAKVTTPGVLGARRYRRGDGTLAGDMIYDVFHPPGDEATMVDPADATRRKSFDSSCSYEELLVPAFREGTRVEQVRPLAEIRRYCMEGVADLDPSITRFLNPHTHPVGLERGIYDLRTALVLRSRGIPPEEATPSAEAVAEADAVTFPLFERKE
jgi:nicotinate phosphoribosyltransferase